MSLLLAGLTVLVIGDSHMATKDYLITTLHDELMQQGAKVYSYGACGSASGDWMKVTKPECGTAFRLDAGPLWERQGEAAISKALPDLVSLHHPDLIVVVNGDTMAGYKDASMPKPWIRDEVRTLTNGIKATGTACLWVGPAWGGEGHFHKTDARVQELSNFLADNVAPCSYINSLTMSKPGEWTTISGDGQHFSKAGYLSWGHDIASQIVSSDVVAKIKH